MSKSQLKQSLKLKGADMEIISIPVAFIMVTVFLLLASIYSENQFTVEYASIENEHTSQYETYATSAALFQDEQFRGNLTKITYGGGGEPDARNKIQDIFYDDFPQGYTYNPNYRVVLRDEDEEELFTEENGGGSFSYSKIYVASPEKSDYTVTVGIDR